MMRDVTAEKTEKITQMSRKAGKLSVEIRALDRCWGQIGIPAVAAAARYLGGAKNPAYAPVETEWQARASEAAA